jgi:prepilin-type N-terminal cleavage/methylation domain-containing protein
LGYNDSTIHEIVRIKVSAQKRKDFRYTNPFAGLNTKNVFMMSYEPEKNKGFTLIELMIVIAIIGTLAGIAFPIIGSYIDRAKIARAKVELGVISKEIVSFYFEWDKLVLKIQPIFKGSLTSYLLRYQTLALWKNLNC